jgi:hypothetical protein
MAKLRAFGLGGEFIPNGKAIRRCTYWIGPTTWEKVISHGEDLGGVVVALAEARVAALVIGRLHQQP